MTLRGTQARYAIASDNLASQRQILQITQWRLRAGLVTTLEVDQAQAVTEQTQALLPQLQATIEQTHHVLAVLIGQAPAVLNAELAALAPVPHAAATLTLAIPAETLRQRPDLRAVEHEVAAAQARVAQADAAGAPNFRLSGSLGINAVTLGALTNGSSVVSALLASVSLPLFDGGAARAKVRAQQAALEQAMITYQATLLAALKDVEDALAVVRGNRERLQHLRLAASAAASAAQLASWRYSSGLVDFQTVLETQRSQLGAQDTVASASGDLATAYVRLYKALGGGWTNQQQNSPTPLTDAEFRTPKPAEPEPNTGVGHRAGKAAGVRTRGTPLVCPPARQPGPRHCQITLGQICRDLTRK